MTLPFLADAFRIKFIYQIQKQVWVLQLWLGLELKVQMIKNDHIIWTISETHIEFHRNCGTGSKSLIDSGRMIQIKYWAKKTA